MPRRSRDLSGGGAHDASNHQVMRMLQQDLLHRAHMAKAEVQSQLQAAFAVLLLALPLLVMICCLNLHHSIQKNSFVMIANLTL
mmetsp:Transcript_60954/g.142595  ORF Transcript_60954/g.142595 Transcript_60954/m.142595 type:complete len:84 (+) Transcript_60954:86-337(+)